MKNAQQSFQIALPRKQTWRDINTYLQISKWWLSNSLWQPYYTCQFGLNAIIDLNQSIWFVLTQGLKTMSCRCGKPCDLNSCTIWSQLNQTCTCSVSSTAKVISCMASSTKLWILARFNEESLKCLLKTPFLCPWTSKQAVKNNMFGTNALDK